MYEVVASGKVTPSAVGPTKECIYFAFFDRQRGYGTVRQENMRGGLRINFEAPAGDMLSADILDDGSVSLYKYVWFPRAPWVEAIIGATTACIR